MTIEPGKSVSNARGRAKIARKKMGQTAAPSIDVFVMFNGFVMKRLTPAGSLGNRSTDRLLRMILIEHDNPDVRFQVLRFLLCRGC